MDDVEKAVDECIRLGGKPEIEEKILYGTHKLKIVHCDFGKFKIKFSPWFVSHANEIVLMSPDEFLSKVPKSPWSPDITEMKKRKIKELIDKGVSLEPIFLDIDRKTGKVLEHEGRHRMMVLKEMGVKKVPVFIFYK